MKIKTFTKRMVLAIMVILVNQGFSYAQGQNPNVKQNIVVGELGYAATTFDDVVASGSYGVGMTALFPVSKSKFGVGFHWNVGMRLGLVDSEYATVPVRLGPTVGYHFKDQFFIAMPVNILCDISAGSDVSTGWGMELSPSIYLGKKWGIYFGPNMCVPFSGGDVGFGFKAGLQF